MDTESQQRRFVVCLSSEGLMVKLNSSNLYRYVSN